MLPDPTPRHVHHAKPWSQGGETSVDNLHLLCSRHHTAVHAGIWDIRMINGIPWVKPPPWVDPHRQLLRNTTHQIRHRARQAAQQLRLNL